MPIAPHPFARFQFYHSSIKSAVVDKVQPNIMLFQFYHSSIKRQELAQQLYEKLNFNSTIVRLKAAP